LPSTMFMSGFANQSRNYECDVKMCGLLGGRVRLVRGEGRGVSD